MLEQLVQGTDAWRLARCGSVGASSIADLMAQNKSGGWGASRANLMARIICERLTGVPAESYVNAAMQHGTDTEPQARAVYSFMHDAEVVEVGLIRHPEIEGTHASPDGLVGDDGLVEIKAPQTWTHIETLLSGKISDRYIKQMQWQMACTGRQWTDFVSFDPRIGAELQMFVKRVPRDDEMIADIEGHVRHFLMEVNATMRRLEALGAAA